MVLQGLTSFVALPSARHGAPYCARHVAALALALASAGCSSLSLPGPVALGTGSLPPSDTTLANNPPTAVYASIAGKALTCWVGPKGPLKSTHIFHAEAASPTTGGKAEIVLHERDMTQPHPWGSRVFRIELTGEGGGTDTRVAMQNIKLPADLADAMRADVINWAKGSESCQAQVVRPPAPEPPMVVKPKLKKSKAT